MALTLDDYEGAVALVTASLTADQDLVDRLLDDASPTTLRIAVRLTTNTLRSAERRGELPLDRWRAWCRSQAVRQVRPPWR